MQFFRHPTAKTLFSCLLHSIFDSSHHWTLLLESYFDPGAAADEAVTSACLISVLGAEVPDIFDGGHPGLLGELSIDIELGVGASRYEGP